MCIVISFYITTILECIIKLNYLVEIYKYPGCVPLNMKTLSNIINIVKMDKLKEKVFSVYKNSDIDTIEDMVIFTISNTEDNQELFRKFIEKLSLMHEKHYSVGGERLLTTVCHSKHIKDIKLIFGEKIKSFKEHRGCLVIKGAVTNSNKEDSIKGVDIYIFSVFAEENVFINAAILDEKDAIYVMEEKWVKKIAKGFKETFQ